MKRGFLVNKSGNKNEGLLGDPRSSRASLGSDGGDRLGKTTGVPKFNVSETEGLTWAPVSNSLRERWKSPWKAVSKEQDMEMDDDDITFATTSTYPSTQPSISSFAQQPVLPNGTIIGDPKSCLAQFYTKEFQITLVTKDCYFSWPDPNGFSHAQRFTSIFVCPVTGELFCTGKYGPKKYKKDRKDSITGETITETRQYYLEREDPEMGANVVWFSMYSSFEGLLLHFLAIFLLYL